MDPFEVQKICNENDYAAINDILKTCTVEQQKKYIQMTDDLLYRYMSRKAFLSTAMKPEEYKNMPVELVKKYTRKIENARFLTACIEDALNDIQEKQYRTVIELIYFQHQTYSQISDELYCNPRTVIRWKKKVLKEMAISIFGVYVLGLEDIE